MRLTLAWLVLLALVLLAPGLAHARSRVRTYDVEVVDLLGRPVRVRVEGDARKSTRIPSEALTIGPRTDDPSSADLVLQPLSDPDENSSDLGLDEAPRLDGTVLRIPIKGDRACIYVRVSSEGQLHHVGGRASDQLVVKTCEDDREAARIVVQPRVLRVAFDLRAFAGESLAAGGSSPAAFAMTSLTSSVTASVVEQPAPACASNCALPVELKIGDAWLAPDDPIELELTDGDRHWPVQVWPTYESLLRAESDRTIPLGMAWSKQRAIRVEGVGDLHGREVSAIDACVRPAATGRCEACTACARDGESFSCACATPPPRRSTQLVLRRTLSARPTMVAGDDGTDRPVEAPPRTCTVGDDDRCRLEGTWSVALGSVRMQPENDLRGNWVLEGRMRPTAGAGEIRFRCRAAAVGTAQPDLAERLRTRRRGDKFDDRDPPRPGRVGSVCDLLGGTDGFDETAFAELPPDAQIEIRTGGDRLRDARDDAVVRLRKDALIRSGVELPVPAWRWFVLDLGVRAWTGLGSSVDDETRELERLAPVGGGAVRLVAELRPWAFSGWSLTLALEAGPEASWRFSRQPGPPLGDDDRRSPVLSWRWAGLLGVRYRPAPGHVRPSLLDQKLRVGGYAGVGPTQRFTPDEVRAGTRAGGRLEGGVVLHWSGRGRRADLDAVKFGIGLLLDLGQRSPGREFSPDGRARRVAYLGRHVGLSLTTDFALVRP